MKFHKLFICLLIATSFLMLTACGDGGGGPAGSGELAIDITDAKPLLPDGVTNFYVTITEVLVHGKGGWESLPLPQTPSPYTIDLLQFRDGLTTELVPPVMLTSGKYTQIRLVLAADGAWINFKDDPKDYTVVIPSENLKTDKNINFDVPSGGSVDLMIDFDLSQSLVVTNDGSGTLSYKLKPVLHIVDFFEAATINGTIAQGSFIAGKNAIVTAYVYNPDIVGYEEYTKIEVSDSDSATTNFSIFWLAPDRGYRVEVDLDPDSAGYKYDENVNEGYLEPGEVWYLNDNNPPNYVSEPI
ncbi:MAG: DUF4382 domain-containing protein [Desulfobacteraceae bacterium]|nr:DUF4382 domain-containing protein [Desulfobacteraceae bacterium]